MTEQDHHARALLQHRDLFSNIERRPEWRYPVMIRS